MTHGCVRFINNYRFLSISLDSLVITLVDNSHHKTMKNLKEELVDNDEILNTVSKIGVKVKTIDDLKKDYPDTIKKLEEALLN